MVKRALLIMDDAEHEALLKVKGKMTWLDLVRKGAGFDVVGDQRFKKEE